VAIAFTRSDEAHLKKVHPDLARVFRRVAADWDAKHGVFFFTCSLRTMEEQVKLKASGASKTLRSRHLAGKKTGLSHAIDVAFKIDNKVRWDWPLFIKLSNAVKAAAIAEDVPVEWGGTWTLLNTIKGQITASMLHKSFPDGPHYQLPWAEYPG